MSYTLLNLEQQYPICRLKKKEINKTQIAEIIGVHKSTISRELHRNRGHQRGYRPKQAHQKAPKRRNKAKKRINKMEWQIIDQKLEVEWGPEQISNKFGSVYDIQVSHEWIYQHVREDKRQGGELFKHLPHTKKYRKRTGNGDQRDKIPNKISIEERPEEAENRERIGDWEADTIIGKGKKGAVVTLVDRKSRFLRMGLVERRTKEAVKDQMVHLLSSLPVDTITCDNGKEFVAHEEIAEALNADINFVRSYASWELEERFARRNK